MSSSVFELLATDEFHVKVCYRIQLNKVIYHSKSYIKKMSSASYCLRTESCFYELNHIVKCLAGVYLICRPWLKIKPLSKLLRLSDTSDHSTINHSQSLSRFPSFTANRWCNIVTFTYHWTCFDGTSRKAHIWNAYSWRFWTRLRGNAALITYLLAFTVLGTSKNTSETQRIHFISLNSKKRTKPIIE